MECDGLHRGCGRAILLVTMSVGRSVCVLKLDVDMLMHWSNGATICIQNTLQPVCVCVHINIEAFPLLNVLFAELPNSSAKRTAEHQNTQVVCGGALSGCGRIVCIRYRLPGDFNFSIPHAVNACGTARAARDVTLRITYGILEHVAIGVRACPCV